MRYFVIVCELLEELKGSGSDSAQSHQVQLHESRLKTLFLELGRLITICLYEMSNGGKSRGVSIQNEWKNSSNLTSCGQYIELHLIMHARFL